MGFHITRPLLNPEILDPWHQITGVQHHTPHVTLIYSKKDVDYSLSTFSPDLGEISLNVKSFEPKTFHDEGDTTKPLLVAAFTHPVLLARHYALRRAGASFDYPEFVPHITIGPTSKTVSLLLLNQPVLLGSEVLTRWF